jgi:hypothetical protein
LGCALPQEFAAYRNLPFISSIDTSNPVMATLDGTKYEPYGLLDKPKSCMNDNFLINKENINLDLLNTNIIAFRSINGL